MPTIRAICGAYGYRDVEFTDEELEEIDVKAYAEHNQIMHICVNDAQYHADHIKSDEPRNHEATATIAAALFAVRARPLVYTREDAARKKWLAERETKKIAPQPQAQAPQKQDTTIIS